MAWLKLDNTMPDHHKVYRLAQLTGMSQREAVGAVVMLLCTAHRLDSSGDISILPAHQIARLCDCSSDPDEFILALKSAQIVVEKRGKLTLKNWERWQGSYVERDRKRQQRKGVGELSRDTSGTRPGLVPPNVPHRREEKRREEKRTTPPPTPPPGGAMVRVGDDPSTERIRIVVAHYQRQHPQYRGGSTSKGWRAVKARLADGYTFEQLCLAIDGCHRSPFHCGENERGRKYQALELICRDADKVNQFIELAEGPGPVLTERTRRNIRGAIDWADRGQS